ncbi:MAG: NAD-dependent epimerase/dehydratase family protein [Puniceicoccaceae bacterium]
MEKILLTGVAGMIGAQTAARLLKEGHTVVGIDNLNDYYDPELKKRRLEILAAEPSFRWEAFDIENGEKLDALFETFRPDAVINLAARAGVRYSMENPHVYLTTNMGGTLNLLESMRKWSCRKLVLASTSSLYAGQKMPFSESLPVNTPISPYAATKKAAEVMAFTYHHLYGFDVSVLRYFTVYGSLGRPDMAVFRFVRWIDEGRPIELFGDGSQSRDFTHVDDIARGTVLALRPLGYEIINLGGGNNPVPMNTIIEMFGQHLGRTPVIENRPFHSADMRETWADISKAKALLGWEPAISLEEGLRETVSYYIENRSWLQQIRMD